MAVEMYEHGFINVFDMYGIDNNESEGVDDSVGNHRCKINNHNIPIKNRYTSTQPIYTECTRMITDKGSLLIANTCFVDMREKLYKYENKNQKERKSVRLKMKLRMKQYHYLLMTPPESTKNLL